MQGRSERGRISKIYKQDYEVIKNVETVLHYMIDRAKGSNVKLLLCTVKVRWIKDFM